jgi:hypothetical protein
VGELYWLAVQRVDSCDAQDQGQHEEALRDYEEALRIKIPALGADHNDVATTLNNIGLVYDVSVCCSPESQLDICARASGYGPAG